MSNQLIIAQKMTDTVNGQTVQWLDFALDDNDKLMVFRKFKTASGFLKNSLKSEHGDLPPDEFGNLLLKFSITTVESQSSNPRMVELLEKGITEMDENLPVNPPNETQSEPPSEQNQCTQSEPTSEQNQTPQQEIPEFDTEMIEIFCAIQCKDVGIHNNEVLIDKQTGKNYVPVLGFLDLETQQVSTNHENWVLKAVFIDKARAMED